MYTLQEPLKQDNHQNSQQANSQNMTVVVEQGKHCLGGTLTVKVGSRDGVPLGDQELRLYWSQSLVDTIKTDIAGVARFEKLPCGYYCIKFSAFNLSGIKILGSQEKELFVVI